MNISSGYFNDISFIYFLKIGHFIKNKSFYFSVYGFFIKDEILYKMKHVS